MSADPIILISVDGLRPDSINKARAKNLQWLIKNGVSFKNARTIRPSITLPAHTSMLTGLLPEQHGITWNDYDQNYGAVKHPTALELAHDRGLTTAMFVTKDKLIHLNRADSLDHFQLTDKSGKDVAKAFKRYVARNGLPDVTFIHIPDPDHWGHKLIWMSYFYLRAVRKADDAIEDILQTIRRSTKNDQFKLIITADHGGHGFSHHDDIDKNNKIPFIAYGSDIKKRIISSSPIRVYDAAATILSLLNIPLPSHWPGRAAPILIDEKIAKPSIKALPIAI